MSLQIWLPLIDNYNNLGLSDLKFSLASSNTSKKSVGKIGPSSYYNDSYTAGGLISNKPINLGLHQSMFCWMNFSSVYSSSSLMAVGGQHRYPSCTGMGITIKYNNSTSGYLSLNTGNGSSRTYNTYCGSTLLTAGTWYHVGFTYDGSTIKLYVNGKPDGTHSYSGQKNIEDYIALFNWSSNSGTVDQSLHPNYKFHGYLNDFRIYDHTLSPKEVELLAQGLVAHYKLDASKNNNLLVNTSNPINTSSLAGVPGTCSIVTDDTMGQNVFQSSTTSTSETYIYSSRTPVVSQSTKYTFSCDIWVNDAVNSIETFWLSDTNASNKTGTGYVNITNSGHSIPQRNSWFHLVWTFTTKSDDRTGYIRIDNNGSKTSGTAAIMKVTNLKLEKGDAATPYSSNASEAVDGRSFHIANDVSGYGNHGTSNGVFDGDTSSPRNVSGAIFDGANTKIELPITPLMQSLLSKQCTINFWVKEANTGSRSVYFGGYSGSNFNIEMESAKFRVYWNGSPDFYCAADTVSNNVWAMFTVVTDINTGIKVYKNGALLASKNQTLTDITTGFTNNTFRIGADSRTGATMMEGSMSDFRIYATALSAEAISDLYRVSGSTDKAGSLYMYEFVEEVANGTEINQSGIFKSEIFDEGKIMYLPDGSSWLRVFYHNNHSGSVLFESAAEAQFASKADKYSRLCFLENFRGVDGKFEFLLTYPGISGYNRWKQTSNPCTEYLGTSNGALNATGYEAISISWSGMYWGGLTQQNSLPATKASCFISGSVGHSNWYYAIGSYEAWGGAIPGCDQNTGVQEVELWVRADTLSTGMTLKIMSYLALREIVSAKDFVEI